MIAADHRRRFALMAVIAAFGGAGCAPRDCPPPRERPLVEVRAPFGTHVVVRRGGSDNSVQVRGRNVHVQVRNDDAPEPAAHAADVP
ncbi:MAG: hypothetical protein AB7Q17_16400 [Phycisphaerae bacterium]